MSVATELAVFLLGEPVVVVDGEPVGESFWIELRDIQEKGLVNFRVTGATGCDCWAGVVEAGGILGLVLVEEAGS